MACGDALGTTLEFSPRGSFTPITDMVGGGPFDLPAGAWTDDCSMALCLAHSLLYCKGFNPTDQMNRYCNWQAHGYMSSTGRCFDIGMTIARALERYQQSGDPYSGESNPHTAGNGSLMRLAPVPMYFWHDPAQLDEMAANSARTTHGAEEAIEATRLFAQQIRLALQGADKTQICQITDFSTPAITVQNLARGSWQTKSEQQIMGTGYAIASLEAALWCFWHTTDYASAVLRAANLGDDADTTAAICGQLAGAYYGINSIPEPWQSRLFMGKEIKDLADRLLDQRV
ncbi:ADP-ribosylglycohydrolase family protein [Leeia aquatica]|uniref:ADP-ribosylglycohydrolase family protein n=1 Tax=Leeia aquatica TaxID=2725557 RepID=UPI0023F6A38D|nr:ADP-ribosylglycohydrolase family protein [Leeia aquatica]